MLTQVSIGNPRPQKKNLATHKKESTACAVDSLVGF